VLTVAAPVVIIEVAAPAANPGDAAALVRACDEAVPGGRRCVLSRPGEDPPRPDAVAIVSWEGDQRVRVEVGVRRTVNSEWLVREVSFTPEDSTIERWRAAGLVIATLVGSLGEREPPPPGSEAPPPPQRPSRPARPWPAQPSPPPGHRPPWSEDSLWIDGGVLSGPAFPALPTAAWRSGFWVGGAWPVKALPATVGFAADYSWVPYDSDWVRAQWLTLAVSAGAHVDAPLGVLVEGRLEALGEYMSVYALYPVDGSVDPSEASTQGFLAGFRFTLNLTWPRAGMLSPLIGFQSWRLERGTRVMVAGVEVGRFLPWGIRGLVGLRLRVP
jgi:hypothetical protein